MKGFSNFPENFCVEWVQMRKYLACVFYRPILLRICRSESTHGTQDFSPKLRKTEKKLPRPPQRTGTPGKDMLYYTIKMKTLIYIM